MPETKETPEPVDNVTVLAPNQKVVGYDVKPWCIEKIAKLSPNLQRVMKECTAKGITGDNFGDRIAEFYFAFLPESHVLISVTLDISLDEAKKISQDDIFRLMYLIIAQNMSTIKNFLALIMLFKEVSPKTVSG